MMNMECCKKWIEMYESKRSVILAQCILFHSEHPKSTSIPPHLRDENWPKECPSSWIKQAIEEKLDKGVE